MISFLGLVQTTPYLFFSLFENISVRTTSFSNKFSMNRMKCAHYSRQIKCSSGISRLIFSFKEYFPIETSNDFRRSLIQDRTAKTAVGNFNFEDKSVGRIRFLFLFFN